MREIFASEQNEYLTRLNGHKMTLSSEDEDRHRCELQIRNLRLVIYAVLEVKDAI
jgi:hypothetical protein